MEKRNVCDFGDILGHAEHYMGIPWNKAHNILVDEDMYQGDIYIEDIVFGADDREFTEAEAIIVSFAMKHGVDEFLILPK